MNSYFQLKQWNVKHFKWCFKRLLKEIFSKFAKTIYKNSFNINLYAKYYKIIKCMKRNRENPYLATLQTYIKMAINIQNSPWSPVLQRLFYFLHHNLNFRLPWWTKFVVSGNTKCYSKWNYLPEVGRNFTTSAKIFSTRWQKSQLLQVEIYKLLKSDIRLLIF